MIVTHGLCCRQRFGLFSQPVSTAICDNSVDKNLKAKKDEDGKVITAPRNFYTTKMKKGAAEDVLFTKNGYLGGGPLINAAVNSMRTFVKDGHLKAGHEKDFKPAKMVREDLFKANYKYIEEGSTAKKAQKDENGQVITGPRNFYTSPPKKGQAGKEGAQVYLGGKIEYMDGDKYDVLKQINKQEREYHHSKCQEKPFYNRAVHTDSFNTHKMILEENP